MYALLPFFIFKIIRRYNNEYDQQFIHYRSSIIGSNEELCYISDNENTLHNVLDIENIKYSKKINELGGMDLRTQNITFIYNEKIEQLKRIDDIYEKSKIYKNNINKLEKIKKNGILHPPEHKTQISASNIFSGLNLDDW